MARFGPSKAKYAWNVFAGHHERLKHSGYDGARRILEVGPGHRDIAALVCNREGQRKLTARNPLGRIPQRADRIRGMEKMRKQSA